MTTKKPSALAAALASATTTGPQGPDCGMWKVLGQLTDADADAVRAVLANSAITGSEIARILRSFDFTVSAETVRRHRHELCACKARGRV